MFNIIMSSRRRFKASKEGKPIFLSAQDRFDLDTVLAREIRMSQAADPDSLDVWIWRLKDLRRRVQSL